MNGPWKFCGSSPCPIKCRLHFKVLKELYVQDGIFAEDRNGQESSMSTKKSRWIHHRMVGLLPRSLEQLTLFHSFDDNCQTMKAFHGFAEMKESILPRLNAITLKQGLKVDEGIKLACQKVGTTVTILESCRA